MATHSITLAWEIPWTEEPGGLQSMELQRVRHDLATKQQPTSVYLVASTFIKGALTSLASLLAISVLPTPVGPFIIMFLGVTSSIISSGSLLLR